MTRKQIEETRRAIKTPEQRQLAEELDCREMINSCLTYGGINEFWRECEWRKSYAETFVKRLGLERVKELVAEQEADFANAIVFKNVFTDSEGCTYNCVQWADEK